MDRTTKKLCTFESVLRSYRPNSLKKAIEKLDDLIDCDDPNVSFKAATYITNQCHGSPAQSVDLTTNGKDLPVPPTKLIVEIVK
jgi:hypothetical protein